MVFGHYQHKYLRATNKIITYCPLIVSGVGYEVYFVNVSKNISSS